MLRSFNVYGSFLTKHSTILVAQCFDRSFFSTMSNNAEKSANIYERKNNLRTIIQNKLKGLSEQDKLRQTFIITNRILNHPHFERAKRLAIYVNMKNEVGTYDIIKEAFDRNKLVFIPLTIGSDMKMVKLNSFEELKTLPKNNWGIIEPNKTDVREDCLQNGGVEYVIVPGVAFTSNGLRLGHGKGYYDRFLAENKERSATDQYDCSKICACKYINPSSIIQKHYAGLIRPVPYAITWGDELQSWKTAEIVTKSKAITVGLAFDEQIVDELPTNEDDFKLDWVIHPEAFALSVEYLDIPDRFSPPPEPFSI